MRCDGSNFLLVIGICLRREILIKWRLYIAMIVYYKHPKWYRQIICRKLSASSLDELTSLDVVGGSAASYQP